MTVYLTQLKQYAGLLSVIGAATIFFSWLISNTFEKEYQTAKSDVERAQSNRRLYSELFQTRQSIDGLGALLLEILRDLDDVRREQLGSAVTPEILDRFKNNQIRLEVGLARVNAGQIDWGVRFCANEIELSRVLANKSESTRGLELACAEIIKLQAAKNKLFGNDDSAARVSGEHTEEQFAQLERAYNKEGLPRFPAELERAVQASNILWGEVAMRLEHLKRRTKVMSQIAFVAYVLGTGLVIFGSVTEKLA
jgi:hypothetical protein